MRVVLNPTSGGRYESFKVDVVSCTYGVDNFFGSMDSVLSAYGLDREHFRSNAIQAAHYVRGFSVIVHTEIQPAVITASKTERWHCISDAALLILRAADCERHRSLRMTHFGCLPGKFPDLAFRQCMQAVHLAHYFTELETIVVDVDEKYIDEATAISMEVQSQLSIPLPADLPALAKAEAKWIPEKVQLDPVISSYHLLEKAETGDTTSMTRLGQYYRFDTPVLALKWLFLATSRGSGLARTLLEYTKSQVTDDITRAAYRLSEFWLSDLPKRIELDGGLPDNQQLLSWLLWQQGTTKSM